MSMWLYKQTEPELWTVGFYTPGGVWDAERDCGSEDEAAERVHYLNGGSDGPPSPTTDDVAASDGFAFSEVGETTARVTEDARVRFQPDPDEPHTFTVETHGVMVTITTGLTDAHGQRLTRVETSPDDESRGGDLDGRIWRAEDGQRIVRQHPVCGEQGPRIGEDGRPHCDQPVGHDNPYRAGGPTRHRNTEWGESW